MTRIPTFLSVILACVTIIPLHSNDVPPEHARIEPLVHCSKSALSHAYANALNLPYTCRPIITALSAALLSLQALETSPAHETKSLLKSLKDSLIDHIGTPVYIHYDRIRHHGLSKRDAATIGAVLVSFYSAKKAAERYYLGSALRSWDFSNTRAIGAQDAAFVWRYKGRLLLCAGAVGALYMLIKSVLNLPIIERFKRSLTHEQKEVIFSDKQLVELINNAHEDPAALADNLHKIPLHDHQRRLLEEAVEKYKSDADPLSLFDDFLTS